MESGSRENLYDLPGFWLLAMSNSWLPVLYDNSDSCFTLLLVRLTGYVTGHYKCYSSLHISPGRRVMNT